MVDWLLFVARCLFYAVSCAAGDVNQTNEEGLLAVFGIIGLLIAAISCLVMMKLFCCEEGFYPAKSTKGVIGLSVALTLIYFLVVFLFWTGNGCA